VRERETASAVKFASWEEEVHQGRCPDGHSEVSNQQAELELRSSFWVVERTRIVFACDHTELDALAIAFVFFIVEA
jgi:hypothetical protein